MCVAFAKISPTESELQAAAKMRLNERQKALNLNWTQVSWTAANVSQSALRQHKRRPRCRRRRRQHNIAVCLFRFHLEERCVILEHSVLILFPDSLKNLLAQKSRVECGGMERVECRTGFVSSDFRVNYSIMLLYADKKGVWVN